MKKVLKGCGLVILWWFIFRLSAGLVKSFLSNGGAEKIRNLVNKVENKDKTYEYDKTKDYYELLQGKWTHVQIEDGEIIHFVMSFSRGISDGFKMFVDYKDTKGEMEGFCNGCYVYMKCGYILSPAKDEVYLYNEPSVQMYFYDDYGYHSMSMLSALSPELGEYLNSMSAMLLQELAKENNKLLTIKSINSSTLKTEDDEVWTRSDKALSKQFVKFIDSFGVKE